MRSRFEQMEQILGSLTYDDTLALNNAAAAEAGANLESDLNYIRSMLKAITGKNDWFATPAADLQTLSAQTNPDAKVILEPVQVSNLAVVPAQSEIVLDGISGTAADDDVTKGANVYLAKLVGTSALADKNQVEIRWVNGDPIDTGDGYKLFGKLEVDALGAIDGIATKFKVKLFKLTPAGGMAAATMPAGGNVDVIIRKQNALGSVAKDAFVQNASFFDVAQETNIGSLEYDHTGLLADRPVAGGYYIVNNESVTKSLDKLDAALKPVDDLASDLDTNQVPDIRTFIGMTKGDTSPAYDVVVGAENGQITDAILAAGSDLDTIVGKLRNAVLNLQGQVNDSASVKSQQVVGAGGYAANTAVVCPEYTPAPGGLNMDVFYMGQLLTAGQDYEEIAAVAPATTSTSITTKFTMRQDANLVFVVRK